MKKSLLNRDAAFFQGLGAGSTAREIAQQPKLWRELAGSIRANRPAIAGFMQKISERPGLRIIFTGAGSSAFIGESMQMILAGELGVRSEAIHTTDIVTAPDGTLKDAPTLIVSFSRSGESPESIGALQYAAHRIRELYNLVLVCREDSPVAEYASKVSDTLVLHMPPESCDLGFAMTSSVSCMALAAWCVFGWRDLDSRLEYIRMLADGVESGLDDMDSLARKASAWSFERAVFLGCGGLRGLAREASVKMLELTSGKVNAGWDTSAGFRHGPKSVINSHTVTIHLLSPLEHTRNYDRDLLEELVGQRKENRVIAVTESPEKTGDADLTVPYSLPGPDEYREMGAYIGGLVFIQLLALEKSLERGVTSDDPCAGGEVNRVVRGVRIYPLQ